jgi:hypothetical protein
MGVKGAIARGRAGYFDGRKIVVCHLRLVFLDDRPVPGFFAFREDSAAPVELQLLAGAKSFGNDHASDFGERRCCFAPKTGRVPDYVNLAERN